MPLLTSLQGELLVAIVTIGYGIGIEKWYVGRASIMANVFTWLVLIFTVDINGLVLLIMIAWLMIGLALVWEDGHGTWKQMFGSKVFGSLALVLGLNQANGSQIAGGVILLAIWALVTGIVFLVGHWWNNR